MKSTVIKLLQWVASLALLAFGAAQLALLATTLVVNRDAIGDVVTAFWPDTLLALACLGLGIWRWPAR